MNLRVPFSSPSPTEVWSGQWDDDVDTTQNSDFVREPAQAIPATDNVVGNQLYSSVRSPEVCDKRAQLRKTQRGDDRTFLRHAGFAVAPSSTELDQVSRSAQNGEGPFHHGATSSDTATLSLPDRYIDYSSYEASSVYSQEQEADRRRRRYRYHKDTMKDIFGHRVDVDREISGETPFYMSSQRA
jgi:hypothetical protein